MFGWFRKKELNIPDAPVKFVMEAAEGTYRIIPFDDGKFKVQQYIADKVIETYRTLDSLGDQYRWSYAWKTAVKYTDHGVSGVYTNHYSKTDKVFDTELLAEEYVKVKLDAIRTEAERKARISAHAAANPPREIPPFKYINEGE